MAYTPQKQILAIRPAKGCRFCMQCGDVKPWPAAFLGLRGEPIATCTPCAIAKAAYHKAWRHRGLAKCR